MKQRRSFAMLLFPLFIFGSSLLPTLKLFLTATACCPFFKYGVFLFFFRIFAPLINNSDIYYEQLVRM